MTHQSLFWIPVALRLALVSVVGLAVGYVWGLLAGVSIALLALAFLLLQQLFYMYRLSAWLEDPEQIRLDDGGGTWTEIFAKLYRMRREDQRNRAELAEWLSRFRQAMSQLPDGVVIMDDVLFLEWCNPVAEQHLGLSLATDKGMRVTNLIRSPEFIDYIILGRYEEPLTLTVDDRKLIVRLIPFENRRHILVSHDVTDFERLDQMRRDFIANASHELRTPLPELDGPTRARHMKLMVEQGQRMQHLVEDMLVLTRLESMDYPLREEEINMRELLGQIEAEANALSAGRHQISLVVDGPDLRGNTEELRSAIGNLVSNAVRYTPDGGQVDIHWSESDAGPKCTVSDSGIGISQEHLSRLTERFYRVDKSRSRETKGTGLGLAIVKHVLMRHDAQLHVQSEAGKGSKFTIQFPRSAMVLHER
jgi:two-component system phosphate regulon sensor histidine kinase PhoR